MKPSRLSRRKPLAARSKKRAALYREKRIPFVKRMLRERPRCQLASPVCTGRATAVDEYIKRSHGGQIIPNEKAEAQGQKWFAACVLCNGYKEDHPAWARERGLTP